MLVVAGKKLSFLISLVFLCVTSQSSSPMAFSDTLVKIEYPDTSTEGISLSLNVESIVYDSLKFKTLLSPGVRITPPKTLEAISVDIDCSVLVGRSIRSNDSIYLTIDQSRPEAFFAYKCLPNPEGIRGVITVNLELIDLLPEQNGYLELVASILHITQQNHFRALIRKGSLCESGYLDLNTALCVQKTRRGCLTCDTAAGFVSNTGDTACVCESGSIAIADSLCVDCIANCEVCPDLFTCTSCSSGYYYDSYTYQCAPCLANCAVCSDSSSCTTCANSYNKVDGQCYLCPVGEYSSGTGCLSCISNCDVCSDGLSCTVCSSGYPYYVLGVCSQCQVGNYYDSVECAPCIGGCDQCSDGSTCNTCSDGYFYDSTPSASCTACIGSCDVCINEISCTTCTSGHFYVSTTDPVTCSSCISHCDVCSDVSSCTTCADGYFYDSADPASCSSCISNCDVCSDGSQCTTCADGYFYDSTADPASCSSCINHCGECSNGSSCTACLSTYYYVDSSCVACPAGEYLVGSVCTSCPSGCEVCGSDGLSVTCTECYDTYYLSSGLCYACIDNCKTCSDSTSCITCLTPLYYVGDHCMPCISGQYDDAGTCTDCLTNCEVCSDGSTCTTCTSPYVFSSVSCSLCTGSTFYDNSVSPAVCTSCPTYCTGCTSSTACTGCSGTYVLSGGLCVQGYLYLQSTDVSSFQYTSTYDSAVVTFTKQLVVVGGSSCSSFFTSDSITSLGTNPTCIQTDSKVLTINFGYSFTLTTADSLEVLGSLYTVDGGYFATPSSIWIAPTYPEAGPGNPSVIINGPTSIYYSCTGLSAVFDSSRSTGAASKSFVYAWSTNESAYFTSSSASGPSTTISAVSATLSPSTSLTVTLTIVNAFGGSATENFIVAISTTGLIQVSVDVTSQTLTYQEDLMINAHVVNKCGYSGTITYTWDKDEQTLPSTGSRLYIPAKTLTVGNTYTFSYTATLTFTLSDVTSIINSNLASAVITIVNSPLVAVLSQQGGSAPNSASFSISGAGSYDPDNSAAITYVWTSTLGTISGAATSQVTIDLSEQSVGASLSITLTVSGSNSRTASASGTFTIVGSGVTSTTINFNGQKVSPNKVLTLTSTTSLTCTSCSYPVTQAWSETFGPSLSISSAQALMSFLTIQANILLPGYTYTFQLAVTANAFTTNNLVTVRVNIGAACPASAFSISPSAGLVSSTKFIMQVLGCYDQDSQDLPLTYQFGYRVNTVNAAAVLPNGYQGLTSWTTTFLGAKTYYAYVNVCDTLAGCVSITSTGYCTVTKTRRYLKEESVQEEYQAELAMEPVPEVILQFLYAEALPADMLDSMWKDFTTYMAWEVFLDLMGLVSNMVFGFLNELQQASLTYSRVSKYSNYLVYSTSRLSSLDAPVQESLLQNAERIQEISTDIEYILLSQAILNASLAYYDYPLAPALTESTSHLSIYKIQTFPETLADSPILLGDASITPEGLSVPPGSFISLQAVVFTTTAFSDIVSIAADSHEAYIGNRLVNINNEVKCASEGCMVLQLPTRGLQRPGCVVFAVSEWVREACTILSADSGIVTFAVHGNGMYTLVADNTVDTSTVPPYLIVSLAVFAVLLSSLVGFGEKKLRYASVNTVPIPSVTDGSTSRRETVIKFPTYIEGGAPRTESMIFSHLLIGMLRSRQRFSRPKRILFLFAIVTLEIFLQNCIMSMYPIRAVFAGALSVVFVIPLAEIITLLMNSGRRIADLFGIALIGAMFLCSIVGIFCISVSADWLNAMLVGLGTEIVGAETVIMIGNRLLKIS